MEGENSRAQIRPQSDAVSSGWKNIETGAQEHSVGEREHVCRDLCSSWNALNRLLVHLRGIQEPRAEIKAQLNQFHLEPVLSNMSHRSISKVLCFYFAG